MDTLWLTERLRRAEIPRTTQLRSNNTIKNELFKDIKFHSIEEER